MKLSSLPHRQLRNAERMNAWLDMTFAAAQAAQKNDLRALSGVLEFAAAQAAQKRTAFRSNFFILFAAAQAAQKRAACR